jgi:hypothetical protein
MCARVRERGMRARARLCHLPPLRPDAPPGRSHNQIGDAGAAALAGGLRGLAALESQGQPGPWRVWLQSPGPWRVWLQ